MATLMSAASAKAIQPSARATELTLRCGRVSRFSRRLRRACQPPIFGTVVHNGLCLERLDLSATAELLHTGELTGADILWPPGAKRTP